MAITDDLLRISEDQTLVINNTTALSTNSIDLLTAQDYGAGQELYFRFAITTAVTAGTGVKFEIISADDAALTSNVVSHAITGTIAQASLVLGYTHFMELPQVVASLGDRYIGARYTVVGDNSAGAGKVTCDIVLHADDPKKYYASGFTA